MNKLLFIRNGMFSLRRSMCTSPGTTGSPKYQPSDLQKFILVWTKKYKNKSEIPKYVSLDLIEKSRSHARIKIANYLMLLTALASFGAILAGKAAAKRGESVFQYNQEFHKKYNDEYEKANQKEQSK